MEYLTETYGVKTPGLHGRTYSEALKRFADKLMLSERAAEVKFVRTPEGLRLYEKFRAERLAESGNANVF